MKIKDCKKISIFKQPGLSGHCTDIGVRTPWVLRVGQGLNQSDIGEIWNPRLD